MASRTHRTKKRRRRQKAKLGRRRKAKSNNQGSTPKFAIHKTN